MTKNSNGSKISVSLNMVWKIAVVIFLVGAAYQTLWEIKPAVDKNTEHRIKFEEKITNIESDIAEILRRVRKDGP